MLDKSAANIQTVYLQISRPKIQPVQRYKRILATSYLGDLNLIPWSLLGAWYTLMIRENKYIHNFEERMLQLTDTWNVKNTGCFREIGISINNLN
jgi:hypothetical protein